MRPICIIGKIKRKVQSARWKGIRIAVGWGVWDVGGMLVEFGFFVGGWQLMVMMKNEKWGCQSDTKKVVLHVCSGHTSCHIPLSSSTFLFLASFLVY